MSNRNVENGPPDEMLHLADTMPNFSHFEKLEGGDWRAVSEDEAGEWSSSKVLPELEKMHGPFPAPHSAPGETSPGGHNKGALMAGGLMVGGINLRSKLDDLAKMPMTKRDFTRTSGKIMGALAFGLYLGFRRIKSASAVSCWFYSQATRYSPSCPTYQSCWFTLHCSDGTQRVYRAYCGRCTATP